MITIMIMIINYIIINVCDAERMMLVLIVFFAMHVCFLVYAVD